MWITNLQNRGVALRRADLSPTSGSGHYDEKWLQTLLHNHPEIFPTEQIEPGFGDLVPLCRELGLSFGGGRHGALDNLFATRDGGLLLVEAKLWRNPEARRAAVAQAMEYAAAVFGMGYAGLQTAILKARAASGEAGGSLFEIVSSTAAGIAEAEFVDALTRNLSRGRAIIAVVGDGIREDIVPLINLLQSHAGHRFTFALVELAIYEAPQPEARLVVPSVIAQTALIERGVVHIDRDGASEIRVQVTAPPAPGAATPSDRRMSIGEDEFFENLAQRFPALPSALKAFLAKAEEMDIYTDLQSGLSLKHNSPTGKPLNVGTIRKDGYVDTSPATWWDRKSAGQTYNETLAKLIGGCVNTAKGDTESALRTAAGKTPLLSELLPHHEQAWLEAIDHYVRSVFAAS